ncbi:SMI1/KNR4 family protein [Roseateles sp. BYS180W]|uniref:SMI1/KNR4 family protein n=1 Tax=Roseateles rivi TaxID=3299028 RepID=A0ABW7FU40_9BURK
MRLNPFERFGEVCKSILPHHPLGGLNAPATEQEIALAEEMMQQQLPPDVKEAYRHFNGQCRDAPYKVLINHYWLPVYGTPNMQTMASEYSSQRYLEMLLKDDENFGFYDFVEEGLEYNSPIHEVAFHPGRLPFAADDSDSRLEIDVSPPPTGVYGQILKAPIFGEMDGNVWASSFSELIEKIVCSYESGKIFCEVDGKFSRWLHKETNQDLYLRTLLK